MNTSRLVARLARFTAPVDVTITMADSEFDNEVAGREVTLPWAELCALEHDRREDKKRGAPDQFLGFSLATFAGGPCDCGAPPRGNGRGCPDYERRPDGPVRGHRVARNVLAVTVLGVDLDKGADGHALEPGEAAMYLGMLRRSGRALAIYSSHSYPEKHSYRVLGLLSRPVTPAEWERGFYGAALRELGVPSGIGERPDPRRFWYAPSARPNSPIVAEAIAGAPIDVDAIVAVLPVAPPRAPAAPSADGSLTLEGARDAWFPDSEIEDAGPGERRAIVECPNADAHSNDDRTAMVFERDGKFGFKCLHGHCEDWTWREFRKHHDASYDPFDSDETPEVLRSFAKRLKQRLTETGALQRRARADAPAAPPTDDALRAALKKAIAAGKTTDNEEKADRAAILGRLLKQGEFFTSLEEIGAAIVAVIDTKPSVTREQLAALLLSPAGQFASEVDDLIESGFEYVAERDAEQEDPETADFERFVAGPQTGAIKPASQRNFDIAFSRLGVHLGYDEFDSSETAQVGDRPPHVIEDHHVTRWFFRIEEEFKFQPSREIFDEYIIDRCRQNTYHPVRDYLDRCEALSGDDKLPEEWLIRFGGAPDTPLVRAQSRIMLVAAVRRIRKPGAKFDEILVLESLTQGLRKSEAIKALVPVRSWFTDDISFSASAKEIMEITEGVWIVECAEMRGHGRAGSDHAKNSLSRGTDRARLAYGRRKTVRGRHWVQFGSVNNTRYLRDQSGNRRYWGIRLTQQFNVAGLIAVRDELWGAAARLETANPSEDCIRLDPSLYGAAEAEQEARRALTAAEETIRQWLTTQPVLDDYGEPTGEVTGFDAGKIRKSDVVKLVYGLKHPTSAELAEIDEIMMRIGWAITSNALRFGKKVREHAWVRGPKPYMQLDVEDGLDARCVKRKSAPNVGT